LYLEEAAMEILNTIVGNATADLAEKGAVISLSPPIIVSEARSVLRQRKARFYSVNLLTDSGELQIHCIGPKELFDNKLNYVPEAS
jgi:CheY-specific phosphatase CheX